MLLPQATRTALLNSALKGKPLAPEQLLASMYGNMGGVFGNLQGNIGATFAAITVPRPPTLPKALWEGIDIAGLV